MAVNQVKTPETKKTGKRLFRYAWPFRKTIFISLFFLAIAAAAELTGPFIAKTMIDNHIVGVEQTWVETPDGDVSFDDRAFSRMDRHDSGQEILGEASVVQIGLTFYFVEASDVLVGEQTFEGGELTVNRNGETASYPAQEMTRDEVYQFYAPEVPYIVGWMALYLGLIILSSFFHYYQSLWLQTSANRIIKKMREDVFKKVHELPVQYFDQMPTGKIVSRITNDTEAIRELYVRVLATFFTGIIYMIGIFFAIFLLDVRLALATLVIIPILIIWMIVYRSFAGRYNRVIREKLSDLNGRMNENIQGMSLVQAFGREKAVSEEFETHNDEHYRYNQKMLTLNSLTSFNLIGLIRNIAFVTLVWYFAGGSMGVGMIFSLGVVYAFVDYINRLFEPINGIVGQLAQLEEARIAGERVFHLMDQEGESLPDSGVTRFHGDVAFRNVWLSYEPDHPVLKDITFSAKKGETVAFVGHTGSGKSSIMNVLFRFYDHDKGDVTIDGKDTLSMTRQEVRSHMAIVLQDPFLFTGTIYTNVSMGDPSITKEQVRYALDQVGASAFIESLPSGIDEEVKEKGSTFSSGERQLISFARALVVDPAILILDEATANIDTETEAMIQHALDVVKAGRTTFVIAHRLSTIREADQIIVLNEGEIAEQGDHESLMARRGRYHHMYQLQKGASSDGQVS